MTTHAIISIVSNEEMLTKASHATILCWFNPKTKAAEKSREFCSDPVLEISHSEGPADSERPVHLPTSDVSQSQQHQEQRASQQHQGLHNHPNLTVRAQNYWAGPCTGLSLKSTAGWHMPRGWHTHHQNDAGQTGRDAPATSQRMDAIRSH